MNTRKTLGYGTRNLFRAFAVMITLLICTLSLTGCDNGDGAATTPSPVTYAGFAGDGKEYKLVITKDPNSGGDNPGTGTRDSRLVNVANQAWINGEPVGERDGFIFKADGVLQIIDDYTDTTPGVFALYGTSSWSTSGNNSLTITGNGSLTYSYTVSGDTLTLTDSNGKNEVFTKTTVTVSGRSVSLLPAPAALPAENTAYKAEGREYKFVAARSVSGSVGRAATDAPQNGDKFTLTIKNAAGTTVGTSNGIITDIKSTAGVDTFTLDNEGDTFTVKIKALAITEIPDPIPLDDGGTLPAPGTLTVTKPNNTALSGTITISPTSAVVGTELTATYSGSETVSYQWKRDGTNVGTNSNKYTPTEAGSHTVTVSATGYTSKTSAALVVTAGGGAPGKGDPTHWTAVADSNSSGWIYAIAYGSNRFVVVGNNGKIAYSDNGVTWTEVAAADNAFRGMSANIQAIAYGSAPSGAGRFVAGTFNGDMAYSDNGITWTRVEFSTFGDTSPGNRISAIAYGNNRFVVVGNNGKIAYSADGVTWTAVADTSAFQYDFYGLSTTASIHAIAYGNNRFVAGGTGGAMAYSDNGVTWTAVADTGLWDGILVIGGNATPQKIAINAITYGNNRWVAGGDGLFGKMAYSTDNGENWIAVADNSVWKWIDSNGTESTTPINGIAYGSNKFVAVGPHGRVAYSTDGATWTAVSSAVAASDSVFLGFDITAVTYGNNRFVAVGSNGKIWYSD